MVLTRCGRLWWLALSLIVLAACAGDSPAPKRRSITPSSSTSAATATSATTQSASEAVLVFAQCGSNKANSNQRPFIELTFLSAAGGRLAQRYFEFPHSFDHDPYHCDRWEVKEPNLRSMLRGLFDRPFENVAAFARDDAVGPLVGKIDSAGRTHRLEIGKASYADRPKRQHLFFAPDSDQAFVFVEGELAIGQSAAVRRFVSFDQLEQDEFPIVGKAELGTREEEGAFIHTVYWLQGDVAPLDVQRHQVPLPALPGSSRDPWSAVRSPAGSEVAFLTGSTVTPELWVVPAAGGEPRLLMKAKSPPRYPDHSYLLAWEVVTGVKARP